MKHRFVIKDGDIRCTECGVDPWHSINDMTGRETECPGRTGTSATTGPIIEPLPPATISAGGTVMP